MICDNKRGVSLGLLIVTIFASRTINNKPIQKQKDSIFIFQGSMKLDFGAGFEASVGEVVDQRDNWPRNFEVNLLLQNLSMFEIDVGHIKIEIQPRII